MQIRLPVVWEVSAVVTVEADSIEEGIKVFKETEEDMPLPDDPDYVDGSFKLWTEDEDTIKLFQRKQDAYKDA